MRDEPKRPYHMRKRAQLQDETRLRIVEAAMHLHEEIGPRATTISAIAERADVQRLTVYRHFSDETSVFQACTSHWLSLNPPPDPADWSSIADPWQRLHAALAAFYRYYSGTRKMWAASHRDVADVPALQEPMRDFAGYLASIAKELAGRFEASEADAGRVSATILHALAFASWADLEAHSLDDAAKTALVEHWMHGVLKSPAGR
jgi:AcrR family transcriptional regulator